MGANPTQAKALALFLVAFTLIAAGLSEDINYLYLGIGVALLAASAGLFLKCKPWEHNEQ